MHDDPTKGELARRLEAFLSEYRCSVEDACHIESLLREHFAERRPFEELADQLAQYNPHGSDLLYDADTIRPQVEYCCRLLRGEAGRDGPV